VGQLARLAHPAHVVRKVRQKVRETLQTDAIALGVRPQRLGEHGLALCRRTGGSPNPGARGQRVHGRPDRLIELVV
jgi:hypothetical protein